MMIFGAEYPLIIQNSYYSDIILISPLRLKLVFQGRNGKILDGRSVYDFFSSIEIMILLKYKILKIYLIPYIKLIGIQH